MNKTSRSQGKPTLQTVERALTFLEYVAAAKSPPTVQQVSVGLSLNITTCYHLMRTLLSRGYLDRRSDGKLRLGGSVGALFRTYQLGFNVNEQLSAIVTELADATAETAFLSTLDDRNVILKVLVEGSQPLRVGGLYVGLTGNEPHRAAGKAVLAHVDTDLREEIIEPSLAELSATARRRFLSTLDRELEEVREKGWAIDIDTSPGITSIGAPIFARNESIVGAIGIVAPTSRFHEAQDKLLQSVVDGARLATETMVYTTD